MSEWDDHRNIELKETEEDIALNMEHAPVGSRWRHKKTGGEYTIVMHAIIELTLSPSIVYRDEKNAWVRPALAFFDRFERIDECPAHP